MKYFLSFIGLLLIIFATVHFLIPAKITTSIHLESKCKDRSIYRLIKNKRLKEGICNKISYKFLNDEYSSPAIKLNINDKQIYTTLNNYTHSTKGEMIQASYITSSNNNVIEKIKNWIINRQIKSCLNLILKDLDLTCSDTQNVYGNSISAVTLQDSTLIYIKNLSDSFPSVSEIYKNIKLLEQYAASKNAKCTNHPMLNIRKTPGEDLKYEFSLALPVDKDLPPHENIVPKRMLAGGNFLSSTVKGGFGNVAKMELNMEHYISDYAYSSPAIPFQSLVTNRMDQKDSTLWITKLYYPIF